MKFNVANSEGQQNYNKECEEDHTTRLEANEIFGDAFGAKDCLCYY
jgi:hypothetical protein